ncbi:MAG: PEP-CTERM sorting domain-containing protein [Terriglobales bacterium]
MNDGEIGTNVPGKTEPGKTVRRRRTWYRRRVRNQKALLALLCVVIIAGALWQNVARHFSSLPAFHASQALPASFWGRANRPFVIQPARPKKFLHRIPGIYPYSVIPGGFKSVEDLRYAALRDYVIRRHYAHFDFSHAHFERAQQAREVYLSYRIRDKIFWTRRRAHLLAGELLLTDGNITARARCGNQISDTAKPDVSDEEPDEDVLDQPVAVIDSAPSAPIHPMLASPDLPIGQPTPPQVFAGNFSFPYVPVGVPIPSGLCPAGEIKVDGRCKKHHKKPVVPEPSTMVLLASGLAMIGWRYRKTAGLPLA